MQKISNLPSGSKRFIGILKQIRHLVIAGLLVTAGLYGATPEATAGQIEKSCAKRHLKNNGQNFAEGLKSLGTALDSSDWGWLSGTSEWRAAAEKMGIAADQMDRYQKCVGQRKDLEQHIRSNQQYDQLYTERKAHVDQLQGKCDPNADSLAVNTVMLFDPAWKLKQDAGQRVMHASWGSAAWKSAKLDQTKAAIMLLISGAITGNKTRGPNRWQVFGATKESARLMNEAHRQGYTNLQMKEDPANIGGGDSGISEMITPGIEMSHIKISDEIYQGQRVWGIEFHYVVNTTLVQIEGMIATGKNVTTGFGQCFYSQMAFSPGGSLGNGWSPAPDEDRFKIKGKSSTWPLSEMLALGAETRKRAIGLTTDYAKMSWALGQRQIMADYKVRPVWVGNGKGKQEYKINDQVIAKIQADPRNDVQYTFDGVKQNR